VTRRRIVLDTDLAMGAPGSNIDDGFALALAVADPDIEVDLVTTVHGNTDVDTATRLSRELLERVGRADMDVVRGAAAPLLGGPRRTGTGSGTGSGRRRAATEIVERVLAEPGELTVVAIGPLTNVALALLLEPAIAAAVDEIVVMGGIFMQHTNDATRPGESNVSADPEAANVVLRGGAPLRFVGLDVTRRVRLTREHAAEMAGSGRPFARFAGECALGWIDHNERHHPGDPREQGSCALHDPLAVAVLTRPGLVSWSAAHVEVETVGRLTRGVCVADLLTSTDPPAANCEIATDVDADAFMSTFLGRVGAL
jgi:purine nucleosidase